MDPLAVLYSGHSPYSYVVNNPINAIDPDGRLVIFINGNHYGSGGSSDYWGKFGTDVKSHFKDKNELYIDGALGGYVGMYTDVYAGYRINQISSGSRRDAGYRLGKRKARQIIESLGSGETIKIITHSMGGTFGRGFAQALEEVAEEMGITDRKILTLVADFDPFQGKKLENVDDTFIQQYIHDGLLANQRDEYADEVYPDESKKSHSIITFLSDVSKLKEGTYKWNGKKWECTSCKENK